MAKHQAGRTRRAPSTGGPRERLEFWAEAEWMARLGAAAKALGLSRAGYIRMAVTRQLQADRRAEEGGGR
jgi:hypothetical protein